VAHQLASLLAWLGPNAVWVALVGPVLVRLVGHWLPEELFMMGIGVVAARAGSPAETARILAAVWLGHFATDQTVYLVGLKLRSALMGRPAFARPIERVAARLEASPSALAGLVPARVFPLGRGVWLAACGVVGIRWPRFAAVDAAALVAHVALWCGLGWWLGNETSRLVVSAEIGRLAALWAAAAAVSALLAVLAWRRWKSLRPAARRLSASFGRPRR